MDKKLKISTKFSINSHKRFFNDENIQILTRKLNFKYILNIFSRFKECKYIIPNSILLLVYFI